ncbi:MAG TPA: hypothetical protein VK194_08770 [Candidatus Deferrimicrobium sp.]|nr:hypothetical protein [Candidatus Deferrimicrobium sp.]
MTRPDPVAPFLARLDRLNLDDLGMVALPEPDAVLRAALLQRALDAAATAGPDRLAELRATPGRARDEVVRAYSRRSLEPSWFGLMWARSIGRAEDRARLIAAIEDAAVAEVVADLLPADELEALREPFELAASMVGAAPPVNPRLDASPRSGFAVVAWLAAAIVGLGLPVAGGIAALLSRRRRGADQDD